MGIGDLAKPISKRNTSVKKQSFTTPYNSNSRMSNNGMTSTSINQMGSRNSSFSNTANQYGSNNSFNQNYNKPIKSSPYGGTQQGSYGQQQQKQYQSTPYGGNIVSQSNYNRYAQSQAIQQPQQIQKPMSNMQTRKMPSSPQNFADYMNLNPSVQNIFGSQVRPTIVQNNMTNAGRTNTSSVTSNSMGVNRNNEFGNIKSDAADTYYSYMQMPEFKASALQTAQKHFLDNKGQIVPANKLTAAQKTILNNSKDDGTVIQFFNLANQKLNPGQINQLPQNLRDSITQEQQRQLSNQQKAHEDTYKKTKEDKILDLQNQIKNSINSGKLNSELAMQLSREGIDLSNFKTVSNRRR
jgi:hypothetical protein